MRVGSLGVEARVEVIKEVVVRRVERRVRACMIDESSSRT